MKTSRFIAGLSAALIATSMTAAIPASAGGPTSGNTAASTTVANYDLIDVVNAFKDAGIDNENVKNIRNFLILNCEFFDGNDYAAIIKAVEEVRVLYIEPTAMRIFGRTPNKLSQADRYHIYDNLQPASRDAIKKKFEKVAEKLNVKTEWSTQTLKSDVSSTDYALWYGTLDVSKAVRKGDLQKNPTNDYLKESGGASTKISATKIELAGSKLTLKWSNGKVVRRAPKVKVTYNGKTLTKGKDYTLSYKNIDKFGKASIVVNGKGDFTGKKTVYFYIVPNKAVIDTAEKLSGGDVAFKVTKDSELFNKDLFDKLSDADKAKCGYQIQFSDTTYFKTAIRTFSTKNYSAGGEKTLIFSSATLGSANKYVRVRAFITVDGKRYYGAWSATKAL